MWLHRQGRARIKSTQVVARPHRVSQRVRLATVLLALSVALGACAQDPQQGVAEQNKAKLDRELQHARVDLGIPDSLLNPITAQEQTVASGAGGRQYSYQDAANNYALLYTQLIGIEQTALQSLKT